MTIGKERQTSGIRKYTSYLIVSLQSKMEVIKRYVRNVFSPARAAKKKKRKKCNRDGGNHTSVAETI